MRESSIRSFVVKALAPLHAVPVENVAWPGYPDVEYVGGVIELKQIPAWPKRADTIVRVEHFTQAQRTFLDDRGRAGDRTWVLLVVGREWLLFHGRGAALRLGYGTQEDLREWAVRAWLRRPSEDELLEAIK
jgi:hypothetical protein